MSTRILALDASTEACSVAIWDNGQKHALYELCPREHTQRLLPMVQQVLNDSGLKLSQLDALAFGRGPGSFTGVRIGIGVAQGLALGADLPMIGISTLNTLAEGAFRMTGSSKVLAAIDARMGEVYWGQYQRNAGGVWQLIGDEQVLLPEQVNNQLKLVQGEWACVGTGWHTYPDMAANTDVTLCDGNMPLPQAEDMLPLALECWKNNQVQAVEETQPVYLRNEVTWKKLPGRE
ncbi:tRNA (adenosine(37)-N6)-threonylcarbamoyltransferase complex dimerization subunit type 1 TsaB [Budvicia aquatica]|uniref:tRNA threonylcarbamoyladenosine biosynthesis protein TsaB n=1 Tax=Budvicia aquatica TaxID=82979 RepID=A0A2C6DQV0_9GAMM|nr:tRNA (adenosine(37)-N6)-threonylcarbamoyltransferase complex dimerization subunit type 1 TsaB [Budvicia aquatica]PHI30815.1 tRNA (adenosine(37)-N6)-threonylcarbamoyltransferase complex dimerization subunit type 1 TsaB [Budvicia aquatica]GKX53739.1 tRNA (adenosine(37)-N6)-threonylcarbamoyltransferase complex dimerization subunit type 1 TsaB [Budvicia aquatica]